MRVGAKWDHVYEDRATGRVYVILAGQSREVPDHVGQMLIKAHPTKLFDADAAARDEVRAVDTSGDNRMVDVGRAAPRKPRGGRRTETR